MRVYETMIIFDPDVEEQSVSTALDRYKGILTERGATVRNVDEWGRRRLAYEIRHKLEGNYVVLTADAEPAAVDELDRVLSLADEVIRHKTIRLPESVVKKLGGQ